MSENVLRASKCFEISENGDTQQLVIQNGTCRASSTVSFKRTQQFLFNSHNSIFFSIENSSIYVKDIENGVSRKFVFNFGILPMVEIDTEFEDDGAYFISNTGNIFKLNINGVVFQKTLPFVPVCFHVSNGNIYIGRSNGEVSLVGDGQLIFSVNSPKSFISSILDRLVSRSASVLAISSTKNFLYFITSDSKLYTVDTEKGTIVSVSSIAEGVCKSAIIESSGDTILIVLNYEEESILKVMREEEDDLSVLYGFERAQIIDAAFCKDSIAIIEGTTPIVSLSRFDRDSGNFISSDWTPADDYEFYQKFSVVTLDQFGKSEIDTQTISPLTVSCDRNENIFIASSNYVYMMRPMADIENILLFCKTEPSFDTVDGLAAAVSSFVKKVQWNTIDEQLKRGENPIEVIAKLVNELDVNVPQNMDESYIISQFEEVINKIKLSLPEDTADECTPTKFWASAATQVGRAVSFYSRCILILATLLKSKCNFNIDSQIEEISKIVTIYTQISVLIDNDVIYDLPIFQPLEYNVEDFSVKIKQQIARLLLAHKVSRFLIGNDKSKVAISYLSLFEEKFIELGFAMLELNRGTQAVTFFKENENIFDFKPVYKRIINKLVLLGKHQNTAEFCELVFDFDKSFICPIMFKCYIAMQKYEKAFDLIIQAPDVYVKIDLIRVFIRELIKKKKVELLAQLDFGEYTTLVTEELMNYSVETLPTAALIMQKLGDKSGAVEALYLYARNLLRENKVENMKYAMSALITCRALMNTSEVAVRDVSSKRLVKKEKISKIISKLQVCLGEFDPIAATKMTNTELLEHALKQGVEVMIRFAKSGTPTPDELASFGQLLAKNGNDAVLSKFLAVDRREWHFCIHEKVLIQYIEMGDPPFWFTQDMVKCCKVQFFSLCAERQANFALLDGMILMRDNHMKLPPHLGKKMKSLNLDSQLLNEIMDTY